MEFQRELSAGYMTNWAARLFARAVDRRLKPLGLSSGQLPIFFALGNGGWLSQKLLVERAETEQPTIAATLSRMARDGLILRKSDPRDGRGTLYSLTPKALAMIPDVRAAIDEVNTAALGAMTDGQRAAYVDLVAAAVVGLSRSLNDPGST